MSWTAMDELSARAFGGLSSDAQHLASKKDLVKGEVMEFIRKCKWDIKPFESEYGDLRGPDSAVQNLIERLEKDTSEKTQRENLMLLSKALYRYV